MPRVRLSQLALPALLALAVAGGLAFYLRAEQRAAVRAFTDALSDSGGAAALGSGASSASTTDPAAAPPARPTPALVVSTLRQLKLVTVRLDSAVTSQVEDESWRGDVRARVSGTATTLYGIDLSQLDDSALRYGPISGTYTITLPPPERIATEIATPADDLRNEVRVGWGRLRDVSGEFHLGRARARLHDVAREQALSAEQWALVERLSKEQVAGLLRTLLDTDRPVTVEFRPAPDVAARPARGGATANVPTDNASTSSAERGRR